MEENKFDQLLKPVPFAIKHLSHLVNYMQSGVELEEEDWQNLTEGQKTEVLNLAKEKLKQSPNSWAANLDWLALYKLVCLLDPGADSAPLGNRAVEITRRTIGFLETMPMVDPSSNQAITETLPMVRERLAGLYRVWCLQKSPAGRQLCQAKFMEWDAEAGKLPATQINVYLQSRIRASEVFLRGLSDFSKNQLTAFLAQRAKNNQLAQFRAKLEEKDGNYFYSCADRSGKIRKWRMSIETELFVCFRSTEPGEENLLFAAMPDDVMPVLANTATLDGVLQKTVDDAARETSEAQKNAMDGYDLPRDRTIAHFRVFPSGYDVVVEPAMTDSILMTSVLTRRYGNKVLPQPPLLTEDPVADLRVSISALLSGPQQSAVNGLHIMVDIYAHGMKDYLVFGHKVRAADLLQLVKDFPACTFTFNTIACFGGGLVGGFENNSEFQNDPALQKRVAIFTQAKGSNPNKDAGYVRAGTIYNYYLMKFLQEGKTYGQAARMADREVKVTLPNDAEAIINGQRMVKNSGNDPADQMTA